MNNYFENVLRGFLPDKGKVILEHTTRTNPDFIVIDVDLDDMPEIVFSMNQQGEKSIGILKRRDMKWCLDEVCNDKESLNTGIYSVLNSLENVRLTEDNIDEEITIQELFETGINSFISMIDGQLYYGKIEFEPISMMPGDGEAFEGNNDEVIDFEEADIKGNGMMYRVYLVGEREGNTDSSLVKNLMLQIENPVTEQIEVIELPEGSGYSPYIFVGDFSGDGVDDILINYFVAPKGGYIYSYIYKLNEAKPRLIFDSRVFNEDNQGLVKYLDNHKVQVEPTAIPRIYRIDISMKDSEYLDKIYDQNLKLREESEGGILGLVASNPVDYDANKIYNLATIQTIIGKTPEDILGLLETFLKWNPESEEFEPFIQYVSVLGESKEK